MKINKLGMDLFPMYGVMIGSTKRTIYHIRNPSSMIKLQKKEICSIRNPPSKIWWWDEQSSPPSIIKLQKKEIYCRSSLRSGSLILIETASSPGTNSDRLLLLSFILLSPFSYLCPLFHTFVIHTQIKSDKSFPVIPRNKHLVMHTQMCILKHSYFNMCISDHCSDTRCEEDWNARAGSSVIFGFHFQNISIQQTSHQCKTFYISTLQLGMEQEQAARIFQSCHMVGENYLHIFGEYYFSLFGWQLSATCCCHMLLLREVLDV